MVKNSESNEDGNEFNGKSILQESLMKIVKNLN